MLKEARLFWGLVLLFMFSSANALAINASVVINETFDTATNTGSYSVVNNSDESINFFAVGHTDSWDAETIRGWEAITVTKAEWNAGISENIGVSTQDYNFDDYFSGASFANVYFNPAVFMISEGLEEPVYEMFFPEEETITVGETTGFQFSYGALEANSHFVTIGSNGTTFTGAAIDVSHVPVPAAVWLFGTAFIGLLGYRKF